MSVKLEQIRVMLTPERSKSSLENEFAHGSTVDGASLTTALPGIVDAYDSSDIASEKQRIHAILVRMDSLGLLSEPAQRRDPLTGLLTKAAILSSENLKNLEIEIPGSRVVVFMDARDMGPAQKFGLNPLATDHILANLGSLISKEFAPLRHEVIRLGGDEFVIVSEESNGTHHAKAALDKFLVAVKEERNRQFPAADPRVQKAQQYAHTRTLTREISADLEQALGQNFSESTIAGFLRTHPKLGQYFDATLSHHENTAIAVRRAIVQFAAESFSNNVYPQSSITLVDFDAAVVKLGDQNLTPELMQLAISKADSLIHSQKTSKVRDVSECDLREMPSRPLRIEDQAAIRNVRVLENTWRSANEAFIRLVGNADSSLSDFQAAKATILAAHGADPSCPGIYRKDLMGDFETATLLQLDQKQFVTEFDIPGFGATNNKLGYAKADQIFRELTEVVKAAMPDAILLRSGGALVALNHVASPLPELLDIRANFIQRYQLVTGGLQVNGRHAEFEHGTREVLAERFSSGGRYNDNPLRPYLFPTFRTGTAEPRQGQTFNEFFQDIEWHSYPTSPIVTYLNARRFFANSYPERALNG